MQPASSASAQRGALPNLLIVGAAKSGTTSLHQYLDHHPAIFMSRTKELMFFNREDWRSGLDWYRDQFSGSFSVRGESSPAYSMDPWFPEVPERIGEVIPEARIIYVVRDPIERLVAQYVEFFALRLEDRPLAEALADYDHPSNRIVMSSKYAHQLDRYLEVFASDRILVLDHRDLLTSRAATLRRVFDFVGVDPDFTTPDFDELHNVRARKIRLNTAGVWLQRRGVLTPARTASRRLPNGVRERLKPLVSSSVRTPALDPSLKAELERHLSEDAGRLRELTGQAFAHWSI